MYIYIQNGITMGKGKNPIYGIDSTVSIVPPYSRQDYATTEIFKMKFAFANYKFLIPWILLAEMVCI